MHKNAYLCLFSVLLTALALTNPRDVFAQVAAGSVSSITGDVHVEHAGTTVPATLGMALAERDRIVTGPNSHVTVTLSDGSKLELDQSSSLAIDRQMASASSRATKLTLFSGLVRSLVSHTTGTTNYEVYTPNAVASARGTEFDTSTENQAPGTMSEEDRKKYKDCRRFTQVSVYQGTVVVTNTTNPSGGSVTLPAGYKTIVVCGLAPLSATPLAAAASTTGAAAGTAAAAGTTITSATALAVAGGVVVAGAVAGGVAASGGGGGGGGKPISPKH
jgi:hypothetical protein